MVRYALIPLTALASVLLVVPLRGDETNRTDVLLMVVMDPLAKPLSCPCVAGYAQRDYEKLAAVLRDRLHRDIQLVFNESLVAALKNGASLKPELVIGKRSVVLHDAQKAKLPLKAVASLTSKEGVTTQRGLLVVPSQDPAKTVADLNGYRIFFGPAECDEKHAAALRLLGDHGISPSAKLETAIACDEGAINILELAEKGERACAVISSYAKPLLEGCGQVPKGALRIVGETEEVPFVTAFINESTDRQLQRAIEAALLDAAARDFALRRALESKRGFVPVTSEADSVAKKN
ncbi:MAG: PhnD/SsuA/transferrin family substrate-binding protein [Pirellulaceae bacterium]